MARPAARNRNAPRKSALAKAALRKAGASSTAVPLSVSKAELAEVLANRQKVDFLDPFMRHAAMQAKGISLCAFLVTLAAFQRGLKVTFHYERASFDPRFSRAKMQGHRGELFSISNGTRTHTFSRTLGDLTNPAANAIAEDKHLTKVALKGAGVHTPEGIVVDKNQTGLIDKFLAQHSGKRFVIKPHDGSLSKGVHADVMAEDARCLVDEQPGGRVMVEEYVLGREYRATVVNGRCVAVSWRERPSVVGDGHSTLKQLVEVLKKRLKEDNPFWDGLKHEAELSRFLSRASLVLDSVPEKGQVVLLSNTADGSIHHDVTDTIDASLKFQVEQAATAVGLVSCGVDLILPVTGPTCILELNQRSYIGMHSFPLAGESPGQGNAVAEAIVDYYFPETIRDRTHSNLAYDFAPIRAALESAQIRELSLPVIGPEWRVLRFAETGIAAKAMVKLIETAARVAGVFVFSAPSAKVGFDLCIAYAPKNFQSFLSVIPSRFRKRFEKLNAEDSHDPTRLP